jgi:hypothetical protein
MTDADAKLRQVLPPLTWDSSGGVSLSETITAWLHQEHTRTSLGERLNSDAGEPDGSLGVHLNIENKALREMINYLALEVHALRSGILLLAAELDRQAGRS